MKSRKAFSLIEIIAGIIIMSIVMVVSLQSVAYMNHIHQENELRYLALNRLDSEMSRLVMAYKNYSSNFTDSDSNGTVYKYSNSEEAINHDDYGLFISTGTDKRNFIQLKDIEGNETIVEDGDFVAILNWDSNLTDTASNEQGYINLSLTYPYIFHNSNDFVPIWDYTETITLQTSIKK